MSEQRNHSALAICTGCGIGEAIDDFKAKRISDMEYLNAASEIREKVVNREHDDVPTTLQGNEDAMAFYGIKTPESI